jgi:hypothetical protein
MKAVRKGFVKSETQQLCYYEKHVFVENEVITNGGRKYKLNKAMASSKNCCSGPGVSYFFTFNF